MKFKKILIYIVCVTLIAFLFSISFAAGTSKTAVNKPVGKMVEKKEGSIVDLTIWKIVLNWINFGILMFLLHKFLSKPIIELLDKRRQLVEENIKYSEKQRQEAEKILEEYREKMRNARKEALGIIEKAKERAKNQESEIIKEAQKKAQIMLKEAKEEIKAELENAKKELVSYVGTLSVKIASKIIEKELNEQLDEKIISEEIKRFGEIS